MVVRESQATAREAVTVVAICRDKMKSGVFISVQAEVGGCAVAEYVLLSPSVMKAMPDIPDMLCHVLP